MTERLEVARRLTNRKIVNMVLEAEHVDYLRELVERERAQSMSAVLRAIIDDYRRREAKRHGTVA